MTQHVNKAKLAFLFQREYEPRFPISRGMHSCASFYIPLVWWTPNGESVRNLVSDFGTDHVGIADDGLSIVETWDPGYNDLSLYVWVTRHHVHPERVRGRRPPRMARTVLGDIRPGSKAR